MTVQHTQSAEEREEGEQTRPVSREQVDLEKLCSSNQGTTISSREKNEYTWRPHQKGMFDTLQGLQEEGNKQLRISIPSEMYNGEGANRKRETIDIDLTISLGQGSFSSMVLFYLAGIEAGDQVRYNGIKTKEVELREAGTTTKESSVAAAISSYNYKQPVTVTSGQHSLALDEHAVLLFEAFVRQNKDNIHLKDLSLEEKRELSQEAGNLFKELQTISASDVPQELKSSALLQQFSERTIQLYRSYAIKGCHQGKATALQRLGEKIRSLITTTTVAGRKVYDESLVSSIDATVNGFVSYQADDVFDTFDSLGQDFKAAEKKLNSLIQQTTRGDQRSPDLQKKALDKGGQLYQAAEKDIASICTSTALRPREEKLVEIRKKLEEAQLTYHEIVLKASGEEIREAFQDYKQDLQGVVEQAKNMMAAEAKRKYHPEAEEIRQVQALYTHIQGSYTAMNDDLRLKNLRSSLPAILQSLTEVKTTFDEGQMSVPDARKQLEAQQKRLDDIVAQQQNHLRVLEKGEQNYQVVFAPLDQAYYHSTDIVIKSEYEAQRTALEQLREQFETGDIPLATFNEKLEEVHRQYRSSEKKESSRKKEEASLRAIVTELSGVLQPLQNIKDDEVTDVAKGLLNEARQHHDHYITGTADYKTAHQDISRGLSDARLLADALGVRQHLQGLNHYHILGVETTADEAAIKSRYRSLAKILHPDKVQRQSEEVKKAAEGQFRLIDAAYQILSDPLARENYDRSLGLE